MSEFTGLRRRTVRVNATADGAQTIVAAVGSDEYIVVLGYVLSNSTTAGIATVQDTAGAVSASFDFALRGGAAFAGNDDCPALILAAGTGLVISNAAGVDTLGHITYVVKK